MRSTIRRRSISHRPIATVSTNVAIATPAPTCATAVSAIAVSSLARAVAATKMVGDVQDLARELRSRLGEHGRLAQVATRSERLGVVIHPEIAPRPQCLLDVRGAERDSSVGAVEHEVDLAPRIAQPVGYLEEILGIVHRT